MFKRMIRRSNGQHQSKPDHAIREKAVRLLAEATLSYTSGEIADCVRVKIIPSVFIEAAIDCMDREAGLENITMEDFLAAIGEARPDCAEIFATEEGRWWLNSAAVRLGQAYATQSIRRLFSRG